VLEQLRITTKRLVRHALPSLSFCNILRRYCVVCQERHAHRIKILDQLQSTKVAGGQQALESGILLSDRDMALFLNISVSYVRQLKKQGMPMASFEEAKLWRKGCRVCRDPISKPPQIFIQHFADFSEMLREFRRTVLEVGSKLQTCFESDFLLNNKDNICGRLSKNISTYQATILHSRESDDDEDDDDSDDDDDDSDGGDGNGDGDDYDDDDDDDDDEEEEEE
jgi:hypothetical protein